MILRTRRRLPSLAYDPLSTYEAGARRTYLGRVWQATGHVPKLYRPQGLGDGTTADRELLLSGIFGWGTGTTGGGLASDTYTVTHNGDDGAGSLRSALTSVDPLWIIPAAGLSPIVLASDISMRPNKTIDCRGNPLIVEGRSLHFPGDLYGPTANIIISHLESRAVLASTSESHGVFGGGGGADLFWLNHCHLWDIRDSMHVIANVGTNITRSTVSWCKFGPNPGPTLLALAEVGGTAPYRSGKGAQRGLALPGALTDIPGYLRSTWAYNDWYRCVSRQPKINNSWAHLYNNRNYQWGTPAGGGNCLEVALGADPDQPAEVLHEYNLVQPFTAAQIGGNHPWEQYRNPAVDADPFLIDDRSLRATNVEANTGSKLRTTGNFYKDDAAQFGAAEADPSWLPVPYAYELLTAEADIVDVCETAAGPVSLWVPA